MTCRELYEFALIEVNKLKAPSLLLEDYNYFINKAVQQYMNTVYNRFDINQQSNDDLRCLTHRKEYVGSNKVVTLPVDYVHLLSCIVTMVPPTNKKNCAAEKQEIKIAAKRLTSDTFAGVLNNYYHRPSEKRPYYILRSSETLVDKNYTEDRKANRYDSLLEIHCGKGNITKIEIDYIRAPQKIELTDEDIYSIEDTSSELEFPDYVCFEIVNIFTRLLMENAGDPRLNTNMAINNTISAS